MANDQSISKNAVYHSLKDIRDSMQFDSGTVIAEAFTKNGVVSLEVRGYVHVIFSPTGREEDAEDYYSPCDFPQTLKDLIAGKEPVVPKEDLIGKTPLWWPDDYRVIEVRENNWFELFLTDNDGYLHDCVVDCEGESDEELLQSMIDYAENTQ